MTTNLAAAELDLGMTYPADRVAAVLAQLKLDAQPELSVCELPSKAATALVVEHHYLHRRPPISHSFGLQVDGAVLGVATFGVPASRHLQKSACPTCPDDVIELNRLWVHDCMPKNTESWFVSRALKMLPPKIVVSYADPVHGHYGYIYRALNFNYAGWTDMDRKTPRYDYIPHDQTKHTREAFRSGYAYKRARVPKVKYWIVTGDRSDRRRLTKACGWPILDWHETPPPAPPENVETITGRSTH